MKRAQFYVVEQGELSFKFWKIKCQLKVWDGKKFVKVLVFFHLNKKNFSKKVAKIIWSLIFGGKSLESTSKWEKTESSVAKKKWRLALDWQAIDIDEDEDENEEKEEEDEKRRQKIHSQSRKVLDKFAF